MCWSIGRMARYVAHCKYLEQLKQNDELCTKAFQNGKYLIFADGKPLLTFGGPPPGVSVKFTNFSETLPLCGDDFSNRATLLGIEENSEDSTALFACSASTVSPDAITNSIPRATKFSDMRMAILTLLAKDAATVSRGYSLLKWLESMKFCPTCTTPLKRNVAGTMLDCVKCTKGNHHYPITHPVAITRVEDSTGERVLLVRQPTHPPGMYSCIAGFIESGEALEDAVRREVAEEAGIVIGKVEYFDSQTWPLPQNSLMLACTTRAMPDSINLDIDRAELEDAKWFTKEEIKEAYNTITNNPNLLRKNDESKLLIPPIGAIAHYLLVNWIGLNN